MEMLKDLVYGEGKYDTVRDTYPHMNMLQFRILSKRIREVLEVPVAEYIKSLPYPTEREDIMHAQRLVVYPESIRLLIIEKIDMYVPSDMIVEKVMTYMTISQEVGMYILERYEQRWQEVLAELGISSQYTQDIISQMSKNN
jgi:hypothetical protein